MKANWMTVPNSKACTWTETKIKGIPSNHFKSTSTRQKLSRNTAQMWIRKTLIPSSSPLSSPMTTDTTSLIRNSKATLLVPRRSWSHLPSSNTARATPHSNPINNMVRVLVTQGSASIIQSLSLWTSIPRGKGRILQQRKKWGKETRNNRLWIRQSRHLLLATPKPWLKGTSSQRRIRFLRGKLVWQKAL